MRLSSCLAVLGLGLAAAMMVGVAAANAAAWSQPGHDAAHTGFNSVETTISSANVGSLAVQWDVTTGSEVHAQVIQSSGLIFAVNNAGQLSALRPTDGRDVWSFATGMGAQSAITADPTNGMLFALCAIDGQHSGVCGLNARTGALLWSWAIYADGGNPVGSAPYNAPVVHDGMVFLGESDTASFSHVGYFVALDETNGTLVWERGNCGNTGNNYCNFMGSQPAAVAGGLVVYDTGYEGSPYAAVCAVSEASGALAWCFPALNINDDNHAPAIAGGAVLLAETDGSGNSHLYALRARTGQVKWSTVISDGRGGARYFPAAAANGIVYFAAGDSPYVFATNATTGALLWQTVVAGDTDISVANGLVFGWNGNGLFALDAGSGSSAWTWPTSVRNVTPFVVNGRLIATCNITDICAFAPP